MLRFQYLEGDLHLKTIFNFIDNPNLKTLALLEHMTNLAIKSLNQRSVITDKKEADSRDHAIERYKQVLSLSKTSLDSGNFLELTDFVIYKHIHSSIIPFFNDLDEKTKNNLIKELNSKDLNIEDNVSKFYVYASLFPELIENNLDKIIYGGSEELFKDRGVLNREFSLCSLLTLQELNDDQKDTVVELALGYIKDIKDSSERLSTLERLLNKCVNLPKDKVAELVSGTSFKDLSKFKKIEEKIAQVSKPFEKYTQKGFLYKFGSEKDDDVVFIKNTNTSTLKV